MKEIKAADQIMIRRDVDMSHMMFIKYLCINKIKDVSC